jgi:hypothetical protein
MMAIFRHIRSVHVHQKMGTYARWGRLEFCKEPTLVEVNIMRKILTALVAALAIAAVAVATSVTAEAGWGGWHGGWHGGWGWGPGPVIGGLAAGALIGGALAAPDAYPYPYGYYTPATTLHRLTVVLACGGGCGTDMAGCAPACDGERPTFRT